MKKIFVAIILLTTFMAVNLYADCDMMALITRNGAVVSDITDPNTDTTNDLDDPEDYFDWLKSRSTNSGGKKNDDGYGVIYYPEDGSFYYNADNFYDPDNQAWYKISRDLDGEWHYENNGWTWYGDPNRHWGWDDESSPLVEPLDDIIVPSIMNPNTDATIVMGHDRQGTVGKGNHPFRFEYDYGNYNYGTYIMMHNGTLSSALKNPIFDFLTNQGYLNDNPSNWDDTTDGYTQVSDWIDSELLFRYLTYFIEQNNGDIVVGINEAFSQTYLPGVSDSNINDLLRDPEVYSRVANFIFSDGENLYAFRNAPLSDSQHSMFYKDNGSFYSINTYDNPSASIELNQDAFVVLSRTDGVTVYENFLDTHYKSFSPGWNWVSFPVLDRNNNDPVDADQLLEGLSDWDLVTTMTIAHGVDPNWLAFYGNNWNHLNKTIQSSNSYKIQIEPRADYTLEITDGSSLDITVPFNFSSGAVSGNWSGYWIPGNCRIDEAFGDNWSNITMIKAKNWVYYKQPTSRSFPDCIPIGGKPDGKYFEYGKGYVVWVSENFTHTWNIPAEITPNVPRPKATEFFTFEEKADYEAIDIVGIPSEVREIGVFENGVCVGAVAVQDSSAQILVYSSNSNRDDTPFYFEVFTDDNRSAQEVYYQSYDQKNGIFVDKLLLPGQQDYSIVKLHIKNNNQEIPQTATLYGNYPNPFNPTTTIHFYLPEAGNVKLEIFNIKGQKVKTLLDGMSKEGYQEVVWNGNDNTERKLASGVYFYKLSYGNKSLQKKMLLLK